MYTYSPAKEFIDKDSIGNKEACMAKARSLQKVLDQLYDDGKIEGWQTSFIDSIEKLEDRLIFIDHESVTKGQFPFLHVRIQPKQEYLDEIEKLGTSYDLVKVELA